MMRMISKFLSKPDNVFYLGAGMWWLGGILSIVVPIINWNNQRNDFYSYYGGYIEYQNNQRQQEQQNNGNNYYGGMQDCSWWNWGCRKKNYNYIAQITRYQQANGGSRDQMKVITPGWYNFLGGRIQMEDREREEMGLQQPGGGGVKFVYAWSMILFLFLLAFGTFVMYRQKQNPEQLNLNVGMVWVLLGVIFQYSMLLMILIPQGVLMTDDRDLENDPYGFYGQFGVLLIYFQYSLVLFSGIFWILLTSALVFIRRFKFTPSPPSKVHELHNDEIPQPRFKSNRSLTLEPNESDDKKVGDAAYNRMM